MGSGTTLLVANRMRRHAVGIDIMQEYYDMVEKKLRPVELFLLEKKQNYGNTDLK
jgi:site-specific DNA-methyltransferase (adenine-specific)/site-specific DNA-methyltransferase (cytosine-N4-specific)